MKGYYKIDEILHYGFKFELWESEKFGDEVPCIVTVNGKYDGETFNSLYDYLLERYS